MAIDLSVLQNIAQRADTKDLSAPFRQGVKAQGLFNQIQQDRALAPLRLQAAQQKILQGQQQIDQFPIQQQIAQAELGAQQAAQAKAKQDRDFGQIGFALPRLETAVKNGDVAGARAILSELPQDNDLVRNGIGLLQSGNLTGFAQGVSDTRQALTAGGFIKAPAAAKIPGKPFPAIIDGEQVFAERDPVTGVIRKVKGVSPPAQSGETISIGQDGVVRISRGGGGGKPFIAGATEEQKQFAKARVGTLKDVQTQADKAFEQNEQLNQLAAIDLSTGLGVDTRASLAKGINFIFGPKTGDRLLDVDVPAVEVFRAISGRLQAAELNKASGPQTEGDAARIKATLPTISNENEAKNFLISSLKAVNDRKIRQEEFWGNHQEENGTLIGVRKAWRNFKKTTPLVSEAVTDPNTKLPMFFNDFRRQARNSNPNATDHQIITTWRQLTKGKR